MVEKMKEGAKETVVECGDKSETMAQQRRSNTCFHHLGYLVVALSGLVLGAMYFARLSISVAMLSMVNKTHLYLLKHPNATLEELEEMAPPEMEADFEWSNELQQLIISSYMVAYTLPQLFTAHLGVKYGIRWTATASLSLCGLSCLLLPVSVYWDWKWGMALRMVNGLGASGLMSIMVVAIERWMPTSEAALGLSLMQFVQTSIYFVIPLASGMLASVHWKWAFYAPGAVCLAVAALWFLVARNTPAVCKFVSQKELERIQLSRGEKLGQASKQINPNMASQLPWYFMFRIKSFYPLLFSWAFTCISHSGLLFLVPAYFKSALSLSVQENGFYSFVINIGVLFSMLWPNPIIALLQSWFKLTLTQARQLIVFVYCAMCTLAALYIAAYHDGQVFMLATFRFFHMTSEFILMATLMSQYGPHGLSGPVFSMVNTLGNLMTPLFCWTVAKFLDHTEESLECWSWVFVAFALMSAINFLLYLGWLKSEPVEIRHTQEMSAEGAKKCDIEKV